MELMAGWRKWTRGGSEESRQTRRNEEVSDEEEGEGLHEIVGEDSSEEESEDEMDMLPVSQRTRSRMQG